MCRIVVPIAAPDATGLLAQAAQARTEGADMVEVRLDLCVRQGAPIRDCIDILPRCTLPVLATCRHRAESGSPDAGWPGDEGDRLAVLAAADAAGVELVDCELAHRPGSWRPQRAGLVLSAHDFQGPGGDLLATVRAMRAAGAAVAKVAITARDAHDLAPILALCTDEAAQGPLIAIAMGEHGAPSRQLAGALGCSHTFARLAGGAGSAPGQPTVAELVDVFALRRQRPGQRLYGVIGTPIAHSLSPHLHNAAFAAMGADAAYGRFRVEDPVAFWRACGRWLQGLSITIPHKEALGVFADAIEDEARAAGAVNTLVRRPDGGLSAANTDVPAIRRCLERAAGNLTGKRVLILGAGGVARGAALALVRAGAHLRIANRTTERARALADEVGAEVAPWGAPVEADVLVNGTSLGMGRPDETPWPFPHRSGTVVFDTVYTPLETRLVRDARAAGCTVVLGVEMFIDQAAGQLERWLGRPAPLDLLRERALAGLRARDKA